jgi:hypothetical protein
MLSRLILAALAGGVAYLICVFAGGLLGITAVPILAFVGAFLVQWAVLISIIVALWYFFAGGVRIG